MPSSRSAASAGRRRQQADHDPVTDANAASLTRRASTSVLDRRRGLARNFAPDQTAKFGYDRIIEIATAARGLDPPV
jgi:hypothetical protein